LTNQKEVYNKLTREKWLTNWENLLNKMTFLLVVEFRDIYEKVENLGILNAPSYLLSLIPHTQITKI
jgi:hypothetical protein